MFNCLFPQLHSQICKTKWNTGRGVVGVSEGFKGYATAVVGIVVLVASVVNRTGCTYNNNNPIMNYY